ncbi:hypothetical protein DsansV1_C06g0060651 [Dioscorea sansibarensis]
MVSTMATTTTTKLNDVLSRFEVATGRSSKAMPPTMTCNATSMVLLSVAATKPYPLSGVSSLCPRMMTTPISSNASPMAPSPLPHSRLILSSAFSTDDFDQFWEQALWPQRYSLFESILPKLHPISPVKKHGRVPPRIVRVPLRIALATKTTASKPRLCLYKLAVVLPDISSIEKNTFIKHRRVPEHDLIQIFLNANTQVIHTVLSLQYSKHGCICKHLVLC